MRPPLSVSGTRWTRWTPLSNFSLPNTPSARDIGDDFLEPADLAGRHADRLHPPALLACELLVHAIEVAREQRCLVTARARADFQHGGPRIGGVARQHGQRQFALGGGQLLRNRGEFFLGHCVHFRIGEHILQLHLLGAHGGDSLRSGGHRLQLRIIAAGLDEGLALQLARRHTRLQLGKAIGELAQAFGGDGHARRAVGV